MAKSNPAYKSGGAPKGAQKSTMPPSKVQGGANTGTFHGNHNVAHPIQGASGSTDIYKGGSTV